MRTRLASLMMVSLASCILPGPGPAYQEYRAPPEESPPRPPDESFEDEAPPPQALPPAQPLDRSSAERRLAPYGRWVDTPEHGEVWIPDEIDQDWQPYTTGHWVLTDWGWSFVSDVPWGEIAFHYGRWGWDLGLGWFWVPGFVWAPAWVSWRFAAGFICWSPFPPHGFGFRHRWPGWVVVPAGRFTGSAVVNKIPHAASIVRSATPLRSVGAVPQRGVFYGPSRGMIGGRRGRRGPQPP